MRYFPLYEAKMFHQFDHRWATFAGADEDGSSQGAEEELAGLAHLREDEEDEEEGEAVGRSLSGEGERHPWTTLR